ncbi:MAG: hypothetical protein WC901_05050 [Candidatus Margulisiibacteriota bacterium]
MSDPIRVAIGVSARRTRRIDSWKLSSVKSYQAQPGTLLQQAAVRFNNLYPHGTFSVQDSTQTVKIAKMMAYCWGEERVRATVNGCQRPNFYPVTFFLEGGLAKEIIDFYPDLGKKMSEALRLGAAAKAGGAPYLGPQIGGHPEGLIPFCPFGPYRPGERFWDEEFHQQLLANQVAATLAAFREIAADQTLPASSIGFYPPAGIFSWRAAETLAALGVGYTVMDGLHLSPVNQFFKSSGLTVLIRQRGFLDSNGLMIDQVADSDLMARKVLARIENSPTRQGIVIFDADALGLCPDFEGKNLMTERGGRAFLGLFCDRLLLRGASLVNIGTLVSELERSQAPAADYAKVLLKAGKASDSIGDPRYFVSTQFGGGLLDAFDRMREVEARLAALGELISRARSIDMRIRPTAEPSSAIAFLVATAQRYLLAAMDTSNLLTVGSMDVGGLQTGATLAVAPRLVGGSESFYHERDFASHLLDLVDQPPPS